MCSSSSASSSSSHFGTRMKRTRRQENGTMSSFSSSSSLRCASFFAFFFIVVLNNVVLGASMTEAQEAGTSTTISSSTPAASSTSLSDNHDEIEHDHDYAQQSTSFVTKIGNGFERLVVSIDESLALLAKTPAAPTSASVTSSSLPTGAQEATQHNHQHECQTVLEQLKELLSRTSDYLYKATKGQTYFRQMSILLPPSWANVNCTGVYEGASRFLFPAEELLTAASVSPSAVYHAQTTADIHVTTDHPVYIDRPWTLQYGGCGVPGKKISIPVSFLTTGVLGTQGDLKARLLVREWIKYRYGVFDENGFGFDEKYPMEYVGSKGQLTYTSCHLNRTNCENQNNCNDVPEESTIGTTSSRLPVTLPSTVAPTHTQTNNDKTQAITQAPKLSLLSLPVDEQGIELCDEHTHERTTPTKHNFLCDGKSIWEVMRMHSDFQNENRKANTKVHIPTSTPASSRAQSIISAPPPSFSFVTAKTSRVLFLLDRTQSMNQNNRWTNLRRSLYRMFHHVPAGVELGVISFTNVSAVSLPLTVASAHNRDHLHGRVPVRPLTTLAEDACMSCALRTAVKILKASGEAESPATIVLISGSSKVNTKEWEKISKILESNPLRVTVVSYEDGLKTAQFSELTKHGELIKVSDSDLHSKNRNLQQSQALNNVILKIINEHFGAPAHKVHEVMQWPDSDWQVRGKFVIEESLGRNTWVTVTPEEHGDVDGLILSSPSGKEFDLPLNAEGMTFLRVPGTAEPGIWRYTVKYYHNQAPRPVSIDVVTETRKSEAISVRFWNLVGKTEHKNTEVVLLYAQVIQGELPVLNANVSATISLPSANNQHERRVIRVRLLDTGSGDPDITWGDGIYSAYFTQLGPVAGIFGVNIQVNDNHGQAVVPVHTNITRGSYDKPTCCGSSVPHISTIPTGSFNRHVIGSSFTVYHGIALGDDPYAPGRVTDLRVERVVDSASEIKLSWTAPGGDYDKGRAAKYEIRCYTSREALTNDNFSTQGILVHSSITPVPESVGVRQSCVVAVPWENDYFYYGIVAIDSALNRAKVSNLVYVFIKETPTSTVKMVDAWEDDALVSNLTSSRSLNLHNQHNSKYKGVFNVGSTWFRGLSETELYVVLAGSALFLFLVSFFVVALACVKRNKKTKSESPPAYRNIYADNGKSIGNSYEPSKKGADDGMLVVGCCWEKESTDSTDSKDHHHQSNKISTSATTNPTSKVPSYIPASALYAPTSNSVNTNGAQYRDIYSGGNNNDSSSVGSKPSEGGSDATTHLTHDSTSNRNLHGGGQSSPSYYPMGLNTLNHSLSFDPLHNSTVFNSHTTSSPHHPNVFNNQASSTSSNGTTSHSPTSEEDDEGGFKKQSNYSHFHQPSSAKIRDSGHYVDSSNFSRVSVPMPSSGTTVTTSEYESSSNPYPNGSYGGSIMSISNHYGGSQKKRRHISFV
ncbi:unnamed protein product [Orchesella dallaii]|uniref:VWFA domain-containing protein n=1 Tax=Orchesella dallaii TaxID=48710 RepID=A0ABP1Q392_9HEXA